MKVPFLGLLVIAIAAEIVGTQEVFFRCSDGNPVQALFDEETSMFADYMFSLLLSFNGVSEGVGGKFLMSMGKAGKMGKGGSMMSMGKTGKGGKMMSMGKANKRRRLWCLVQLQLWAQPPQ
jgi:hypothetical protein